MTKQHFDVGRIYELEEEVTVLRGQIKVLAENLAGRSNTPRPTNALELRVEKLEYMVEGIANSMAYAMRPGPLLRKEDIAGWQEPKEIENERDNVEKDI